MSEWVIKTNRYYREIRIKYVDGEFEITSVPENEKQKTTSHRQSADEFINVNSHWYPYYGMYVEDSSQLLLIIQEAARLIDENSLSSPSKKHHSFWKNFLPEEVIDLKVVSGDCYMKLNAAGVEWYYVRHDGEERRSYIQSFAELFFRGPRRVVESIDDRRKIKSHLLSFVDQEAGLNVADGFPIFDYSAIKDFREEFNREGQAGEFVEINERQVWKGGWDGRDGGASTNTFEQFYTFEKLHSGIPEKILKKVLKTLKGAILED